MANSTLSRISEAMNHYQAISQIPADYSHSSATPKLSVVRSSKIAFHGNCWPPCLRGQIH